MWTFWISPAFPQISHSGCWGGLLNYLADQGHEKGRDLFAEDGHYWMYLEMHICHLSISRPSIFIKFRHL